MSKLEDARIEINQIDEKMVKLFEERMKAVRLVAEYKKENQLPVLDEAREQKLKDKNLALLKDKSLEQFYSIFLDGVLKSSKEYQKELLK